MAVKLRLTRVGKKKQPHYRVVATDSRSPRDGRFIEIIGTYSPRSEPSAVKIDGERALHWLQHGAQPSERVQKLLEIEGIWSSFTDGTPLPVRDDAEAAAPAEESKPEAKVEEPKPEPAAEPEPEPAAEPEPEAAAKVEEPEAAAEEAAPEAEGDAEADA
ncbi:MAG: 30S ribosomal protein S16 [Actinomycetota bacterium]